MNLLIYEFINIIIKLINSYINKFFFKNGIYCYVFI